MKKTTIFIFAVLYTAIFNYSFGRSANDSLTRSEPFSVTTLVINADVTVVLVDYDQATLEVTGNKSLTKFVTLNKTADTLIISSSKNKDLTEAGIIYIPSTQLRHIRINSAAHVRSMYMLQIPKLDVVINGACEFSISNMGEVKITGTADFSPEYTSELRNILIRPLKNKKY